jgi:hypothetical protein
MSLYVQAFVHNDLVTITKDEAMPYRFLYAVP